MSPRTAWIAGPLFRICSIRQALWYAHYKKNFELVLASIFVNRIYSSAPSAFPFSSKKVNFIGQGVVSNKFKCQKPTRREGIVNVSRISRIKAIDELIVAAADINYEGEIELIGPITDKKYLEEILKFASQKSLKVVVTGPVRHSDLKKYLCKRSIIYSNNLNTVDKSAIEGALAGCFVISASQDVQLLTGMNEIWKQYGAIDLSIKEQLEAILQFDIEKVDQSRRKLSELAGNRNGISNIVDRILNGLTKNTNFDFETQYNKHL